MDVVSRWLLITRACVFSMTITSALIGGLLAAPRPPTLPTGATSRSRCSGLVLAHAANNMINDYFDTIGGVDTESYTRALYAPHPLLSGLISKAGLIAAIVVLQPRRPRDPGLAHRRRAAGRSSRSRSPASSSASSTSRRRSS